MSARDEPAERVEDLSREWYELTRCPACNGNGWQTYPGGTSDQDCELCKGTGTRP